MKREEQLAYVAGIVDGDGGIALYAVPTNDSLAFMRGVEIRMNSQRCVEKAAGVLGGEANWDDNAKTWRYFSGSERAAKVCAKIAPFMTVKKEQAQIVVEFEKIMQEQRHVNRKKPGYATGSYRLSEELLLRRMALCDQVSALNQSVITHDPDDAGLSLKARTAYVAGLIDAEGMVSILRSGPRGRTPAIRIEMTDRTPLVRALEVFGGRLAPEKRKTVSGKTVYRWEVSALNAINCCKAVMPYLKGKREQAEIAIRYHANVRLWVGRTGCGRHSLIPAHVLSKRQKWIDRIHSLNSHKPRAGAETKSEHSYGGSDSPSYGYGNAVEHDRNDHAATSVA